MRSTAARQAPSWRPPTCAPGEPERAAPPRGSDWRFEWWDQYIDTPEAYQKWRNTWGDYYLDIQDARDLYYRARVWGLGWVGDTPGFNGNVNAALASIKAKTLFIYSPRDQFHLPHHIEAQVKAIPNARALPIDSVAGHLICCNADPQATWAMGEAIRGFLQDPERATKRWTVSRRDAR